MRSRIAWLFVGCLACVMAGRAAAQPVIPDADRYIKLGTRLPELPPGEGGDLRVVAPQEWCRDATHILEVRLRTPQSGSVMPVARVATDPSGCSWRFNSMPAGLYEALVLTPRDERIVANGRATVSRGTAALLQVESAATEVEGWLTSQEALPSPLRLTFQLPYNNRWTTSVAADGSYHVTLGDVGESTIIQILAEPDGSPGAEPTVALNAVLLKMATISRGVVRLDLDDVKLPPVVVHVEVPAIADARGDEAAEATIDGQRGAGFGLRRGFRGQFLATYGDHTVQVWTHDRQHLLATKVVTVRPPATELRVVLEIRTDRQ